MMYYKYWTQIVRFNFKWLKKKFFSIDPKITMIGKQRNDCFLLFFKIIIDKVMPTLFLYSFK